MNVGDWKKSLIYGFGHLVGSISRPDDAHSADSADLAFDTFDAAAFTDDQVEIIECLAEYVAANYEWTGEGEELQRRIERGEV
jgi:hypothetical protein